MQERAVQISNLDYLRFFVFLISSWAVPCIADQQDGGLRADVLAVLVPDSFIITSLTYLLRLSPTSRRSAQVLPIDSGFAHLCNKFTSHGIF